MALPRSEDVERLLAGAQDVVWLPVPGMPDLKVGMRPLADVERRRILAEAGDKRRATRRLLAACLVVEGGEPLFDAASVDELDTATVDALFAAYVDSDEHPVRGSGPDEVASAIEEYVAARPLERLRARHAPGIVAYFGLPSARHATAWQVIAFAQLMKEVPDGDR